MTSSEQFAQIFKAEKLGGFEEFNYIDAAGIYTGLQIGGIDVETTFDFPIGAPILSFNLNRDDGILLSYSVGTDVPAGSNEIVYDVDPTTEINDSTNSANNEFIFVEVPCPPAPVTP